MINNFLSKFIEVLKNRRVELGYTQVEMAQFLSTSLRTYQRVELGESEPSFLFVLKSAEHLKLNLEEIFNYKSEKGRSVNLLMRSSRIIEKVAEKMMEAGVPEEAVATYKKVFGIKKVKSSAEQALGGVPFHTVTVPMQDNTGPAAGSLEPDASPSLSPEGEN